mmetsp:Transcript_45830/g.115418  ORF Transcript_45830/g.115418 Transcript_45830/m.115418 type:complete len:471 (-) Transcript_45830:104-1516(-)
MSRRRLLTRAARQRVVGRPHLFLFWSGLLLLFFVAFCMSFFLEDSCYTFYPWTVTTKFTRSYKSDNCTEEAPAPCHVYLTVPRDPSYEMIVNFHTRYSLDDLGPPTVFFDTEPRTQLEQYRFRATGTSYRFKALTERARWLNWVDLLDLAPDTVYYFVAGAGNDSAFYTAERSFRTFPLQQPYVFGVGGDVSVNPHAAQVLASMAQEDELLLLAIGGDIAYAQGLHWCYCRWDDYFVMWDRVRTPSGHVIPIMCTAGNHEGGYDLTNPRSQGVFYQPYFPQETGLATVPVYERLPYRYHLLGGGEILWLSLDSDHFADPDDQIDFIDNLLTEYNATAKFTFAQYHVPMYRSSGKVGRVVRDLIKHWQPVFDEHTLQIAFENHDHAYKRTKPLKDDVVVPVGQGTVYLGDGCIGATPLRPPSPDDPDIYDVLPRGERHGHVVRVANNLASVRSVLENGTLSDVFNISSRFT